MMRVVVTLSRGALPELTRALSDTPARVEWRPLLTVGPPHDPVPLEEALDRLGRYTAVAFTSPRAARVFADRIGSGLAALPERPALWAAGAATAAPLAEHRGSVHTARWDEVSRYGAAIGLARAMIAARVTSPVLHLCGETRRPELGQLLGSAGVAVHEIECYRTIPAGVDGMLKAAHAADVLVVGSPLIAAELSRATEGHPRPDIVALGPTTAAACAAAGWPPAATAASPDVTGVAGAIRGLLAKRST